MTAILEERGWADGQLGDFLHPERVSRLARTLSRAAAVSAASGAPGSSDLRSNTDVDQRDELQTVGQHPRPVLVIWGKQDPNVPFESERVADGA